MGTGKNYSDYPYTDYFDSDRVNYTDGRMPSKERALALIGNGVAKIFMFSDFD